MGRETPINMKGEKMKVFAIDPGNVQSAYCIMDENYNLIEFAKLPNKEVMAKMLERLAEDSELSVVIERMMNYSANVGKTVYETCEWIGRFSQEAEKLANVSYLYRKDEKMYLCGTMNSNDAMIRKALIDRFAKKDFVRGKGTKQDPDVFFGMTSDCWSATAIAVVSLDMSKENKA